MSNSIAAKNKAIVLDAFETLFNRRDYTAAERFWSPNYIQHSAHIAPGRDGLFGLVKSLPDTLKYEHDMIVAEGNLVIVHGRFSGFGAPASWIAADILVMEEGFWWSTGMSLKTKQGVRNPRAGIRCSAVHSPDRYIRDLDPRLSAARSNRKRF
jgi:predicted SnoaL-like aldol condensation-catalyzing enzyme